MSHTKAIARALSRDRRPFRDISPNPYRPSTGGTVDGGGATLVDCVDVGPPADAAVACGSVNAA